MRRLKIVFSFLLLLSIAAGSRAAVPPEERIPITDPAELAALGVPPETQGVYRWARGEHGAPLEPITAERTAVFAEDTFGTEFGYSSVHGIEFIPQNTGFGERIGAINTGLWCINGQGIPIAHAVFHLPDGVEVSRIDLWGEDLEASASITFIVWEACAGSLDTSQTETSLWSSSTSGSGGDFAITAGLPTPFEVDDQTCVYTMQVQLGPVCQDSGLKFLKARLRWQRKVSEPDSATFNDVPINDPRFQYVEALVESGIAANCAPGRFCPDNPVTRGQLAVFLAKALGLTWR